MSATTYAERELLADVEGTTVEIKIGVQHAARELSLESELSAEEAEKIVSAALNGKSSLLVLTDEKGRKVIVPTDRLAYVEIGEPSSRRVGFGAL
jgi:predicted transcriptional regulator